MDSHEEEIEQLKAELDHYREFFSQAVPLGEHGCNGKGKYPTCPCQRLLTELSPSSLPRTMRFSST